MAKKSSLFKTLATIITTTALTLSVATGLVIGHAVRNFNNAAQQQDEEKRVVETIEKTNSYGLIDEYTITYTDGSKSTFIVANSNGEFGVNSFPSSDGYIPDVKVGDEVVIWDNENIKLEDLSDKCDTINYEIISQIGERVPRKFI